LARLSSGIRLTADDMKRAIETYPEPLAAQSSPDWYRTDVVHVRDSHPAAWSVYFHLWKKTGGRSDLTAKLTLTDTAAGLYDVQIDDIRVL
jgi:hypothetical protein